MKNKMLLLVKAQLMDRLRWEEIRHPGKGRKKSRALIMGATCVLLAGALAAYSFSAAWGLGYLKLSHVIPSCAAATVYMFVLFFTMLKTNGTLFGYRDYDMLMAMPVKTGTVIGSRFLTMYLVNLLLSLLIMVPMGVAYGIWEHPGPAFYLMWISGAAVMPLIPTTIAAAAGALILFVSSKMKHANLFATVLSFLLIFGVMAGSIGLSGLDEKELPLTQLAAMGETLVRQLSKVCPISGVFEDAVLRGKLGSFLFFLAISFGWYFLFIWLLSLQYKAINTGLTTFHSHSAYRLNRLKAGSPAAAFLKKEWKRFLSCMIYILNMGMGVLVALLLAVVLVVVGPDRIRELDGFEALTKNMEIAMPFFLTAVLSMTCTSSVSLSLEGKNLWILKTLPIDTKNILKYKMRFNLLLTIPAGLAVSVLLTVAFRPGAAGAVLYFVIPVVFSCLNAAIGMFWNTRMPNYEWESETAVVKGSASALLGMIGNLLIGGIPGAILLAAPGAYAYPLAAALVLLVAAAAGLLYRAVCRSAI